LAYWRHYIDLRARCVSVNDDTPIQYSEIEAYSRLMRVSLEPWTVKLLCKIDSIFRAGKDNLQHLETTHEIRERRLKFSESFRATIEEMAKG
jgi:hypothetical protein